ncbi:MAG: hypothetical protein RIR00_1755 [Pseudomonadota bacterium]
MLLIVRMRITDEYLFDTVRSHAPSTPFAAGIVAGSAEGCK